jgi:hypothetical protein
MLLKTCQKASLRVDIDTLLDSVTTKTYLEGGFSSSAAWHVYYDIPRLLSTTFAHACLFIASTQPGLLLRLED